MAQSELRALIVKLLARIYGTWLLVCPYGVRTEFRDDMVETFSDQRSAWRESGYERLAGCLSLCRRGDVLHRPPVPSNGNFPRGNAPCRFQVEPASYCNASIKRVIVRFNSLSERRNSSILLMECSTVV
jgi:hypothetical protein